MDPSASDIADPSAVATTYFWWCSPILYCAFVNMFLAPQPVVGAVLAPPGVEAHYAAFFSRGVQNLVGPGGRAPGLPAPTAPSGQAGWQARASWRRVAAALFMDDTTLLARTEAELHVLMTAYTGFCIAFRMRLNHSK